MQRRQGVHLFSATRLTSGHAGTMALWVWNAEYPLHQRCRSLRTSAQRPPAHHPTFQALRPWERVGGRKGMWPWEFGGAMWVQCMSLWQAY